MFRVQKVPTRQMAEEQYVAWINPDEELANYDYINVNNKIFTLKTNDRIPTRCVAINAESRQEFGFELDSLVELTPDERNMDSTPASNHALVAITILYIIMIALIATVKPKFHPYVLEMQY